MKAYLNRRFWLSVVAGVIAILIGSIVVSIFGLEREATAPQPAITAAAPASPEVRATAPVLSAADFAERVFYRGGGSREWGTFCRLAEGQYFTVAHVTANGVPVVGPALAATASDEASDWSFVGVDPMHLDAESFPEITGSMELTIAGYPARDRDGEIISGRAYLADPKPPFWWIELKDAVGDIEAEGVVGGISGSCVLDGTGAVVGSVHANGFSPIAGTTNTWAKVVPLRAAILEAQGKIDYETATTLLGIDRTRVPNIETGRFGLFGAE